MGLWDLEAIDLLGPRVIELRDDNQGIFRFIAVEGSADRDGRRASSSRGKATTRWTRRVDGVGRRSHPDADPRRLRVEVDQMP
jgi:hypothetical protein